MSNRVLNTNDWACPELGKSIDQLNWLSGGMLYDVEAKTRFQRWHFLWMKINTWILLLELFCFTFLVPFNLLNFIITGIQITLIIAILFFIPWRRKQRSNVVTIVNWIATFPSKKFPIKQKQIKIELGKANQYSMLCILFLKVLVSGTGLVLYVGFPAIRYFIMGENYALPFNAHLPFLPPTNLIFYSLNVIHQLYAATFITITCIVGVNCCFCGIIQMIFYLKCIKTLTENMKKGIKSVGFQKWHDSIIETTVEVKSHMKIFCHEIYPSVFYVCEKTFYAFFIVLWLALKTDRRLLPWALTGCSVSILAFVVVALSELALDEFDELCIALYDQPWLELSPKERRAFQMTMIQFQRPICFTTGLQNLTFEWLVNLAKAGYSMGIGLDKLIKSQAKFSNS